MNNFNPKLTDVALFLNVEGNLEDVFQKIASLTAHQLRARRCSIMLRSEQGLKGEISDYLQVFAHYGDLSPLAYQEIIKLDQGIAGSVAATGKPLLIKDITRSPFSNLARYPKTSKNNSCMAVPIMLNEQVIGVINLSFPLEKNSFELLDLEILQLFAQQASQSLQIVHLQGILKSRFVSMAVTREIAEIQSEHSIAVHPYPPKLAKIVAKAFFKELTQAGFGTHQVIDIANEVLSLLQKTLNKHKIRLEGKD
jgi:signal transduction protein with GAF and PtsI domain